MKNRDERHLMEKLRGEKRNNERVNRKVEKAKMGEKETTEDIETLIRKLKKKEAWGRDDRIENESSMYATKEIRETERVNDVWKGRGFPKE